MFTNKNFRNVFILWLFWVPVILGFQTWSTGRVTPVRPDSARDWTAAWTTPDAQKGKPYLLEPFMNRQVAWDSEFYLSVAVAGYDDPLATSVTAGDQKIPLSYAFFPLYPFLIRLLAWPLHLFSLNAIAAATLAGIAVSVLGALGGALALYSLARDSLSESGAGRAAFYLLVFPSGFFLAMVYTEGLFVGLSTGALALLMRRRWLPAALLASLAVLTRSVGIVLTIPMGLIFLRGLNFKRPASNLSRENLMKAALTLLPLFVFLLWKTSHLGRTFDVVQEAWFGRGFLSVGKSLESWAYGWRMIWSDDGPASAYHAMEFFVAGLALIACIFTMRRHPEISIFSLTIILFAMFSGDMQGIYRYVLPAPSVFLFLGRLGERPIFDRIWTTVSVLLLAMNSFLFASDMWAG